MQASIQVRLNTAHPTRFAHAGCGHHGRHLRSHDQRLEDCNEGCVAEEVLADPSMARTSLWNCLCCSLWSCTLLVEDRTAS